MILEALVRHYHRLAADPESDIAPFGYSRQQVGFCLVLNPDGSLHAIEPQIDETSGKPRPIQLVLPGQSKPSGSGINPCFLWDNPTYLLGYTPEGRGADWAAIRFAGFRDRHLALREKTPGQDGAFQIVCQFLSQWDPKQLIDRSDIEPLTRAGFGVFRIRTAREFVHQRPIIQQYWQSHLGNTVETSSSSNAPEGLCLVTGQRGPIARLHEPKIKGVAGAQIAGANIVSFNLDAFNSFGKNQGYNAPVSEQAAFQYATALNALLINRRHRVQLGETTVVFWTERSQTEDSPADALAEMLGVFAEETNTVADEAKTRSALADFLNRYREIKSAPNAENLEQTDAQAPFYVLGLSPNAARISIRFWMRCTVKELADRLHRQHQDLMIAGLSNDQTPSLRQLIRSTARDTKEIKANIAGELARAFLENRSFPAAFAHALLTRIRVEGDINVIRASGLKAYINRIGDHHVDNYRNPEHPSKAYHCGRLLATLAFIQSRALGNINSGVIRRNMGSVMAAPGLLLGRLQRAAEVGHLPKLDSSLQAFCRDEVQAANAALKDDLPKVLRAEGQTLFALGFYQQQQYLDFMGAQVTANHRYQTIQGAWVRSTLEQKVANAMTKAGISYIYEPSLYLGVAGERFPDFVIRGKTTDAHADIYIEVAGHAKQVDPAVYNKRHNLKVAEYNVKGITKEGGPQGRLIILDYRDPLKKFHDMDVIQALSFIIPSGISTPVSEEN